MLKSHLKRLAPLASLAAQRQLIVHGTTEAYLVPAELLEDACDVARFAVESQDRIPTHVDLLSSLVRLAELAKRVVLEGKTNALLIESDPVWAAVREQAGRCLAAGGFDLRGWELEEGLRPDGAL